MKHGSNTDTESQERRSSDIGSATSSGVALSKRAIAPASVFHPCFIRGSLPAIGRRLRPFVSRIVRVHGDERGTISILSTFAMLMFTFLLLLVTNVAQQYDDKVRMQNAADASAYSGGVVLARGMNAIAFGNHLECDILAVTAFLREARDRNVERLVPEILAEWERTGQKFRPAQFEKFRPLPAAISGKIPLEQELVTAWSEMANSAALFALPVFEHILGTPENLGGPFNDNLIPAFQRDVLRAIPSLAQEVTLEVALRHGVRDEDARDSGVLRNNPSAAVKQESRNRSRGPQLGVLWRTSAQPVGIQSEDNPQIRTLPVIDPDPSQTDFGAMPDANVYLSRSISRRRDLSHHYVNLWVEDDDLLKGLGFFGDHAKMSQFMELFRIACCAQLNELLTVEYPTTNVPMMLRRGEDLQLAVIGENALPVEDTTTLTEDAAFHHDYSYVGCVYRPHVNEMGPQMYSNPLDSTADALTFAQINLFIPRPMFHFNGSWRTTMTYYSNGQPYTVWANRTNGWPNGWTMFSQNWMVRLVPATTPALPRILQSNPGGYAASVRPPSFGGATLSDIDAINTH